MSDDDRLGLPEMPPMPLRTLAGHEGPWVKYDDVANVLAFIEGYLLEHCHMLESQHAHPKIIEAMHKLRREIEKR